MVSDPTAKEIIKELKIKPESVRKVVSTVLSIKVYGMKPASI